VQAKIKSMKQFLQGVYINATKGAAVSFVVFCLAAFLLPEPQQNNGYELVLTISTFLFAIIAGFFISRLNSRFDAIRTIIGEGDGEYLALYKMSQLISPRFSERIRKILSDFYIVAYDFALSDYNRTYKASKKYYMKFWSELKKLKKSEKDNVYHEKVVDLIVESEKRRNVTSSLASEKLTIGQWAVLIILSVIIVFCIFSLKTTELSSKVLAILLSTVLVLVLLLMRDLQNLILGNSELLEESGQEMFEDLGELRYYQAKHLKSGLSSVPKHIKKFRLGLHEPGAEEFNIKIITRK